MNTLISERAREFQQSNSQSKAPRGKRLANNIGLNITDDASVYMTVKEKEEKKHQSQQSSLSQYSNSSSVSEATNTLKRRGRPPKKTLHVNHKICAEDNNINSNTHYVQSKIATGAFDSEDSDQF